MVLHALHLCSGYGGFELGLRHAGVECRTVGHVERDSYAAAVLVERMEQERLDLAPVWSDLDTFDAQPWAGRVELVTAGFPCQPFSAAGQRKGTDDDRWLWPSIGRIIRDVGPRYVFLENVPGLVRAGLPHVLADLANLGFDAEWGLLSASAVGAPHRRRRVWILAMAHNDDDGFSFVGRQPKHDWEPRAGASRPSAHVADPVCSGWQGPPGTASADGHVTSGGFPPRPADHDGWDRGGRDALGSPVRRAEASGSSPHVADTEGARRNDHVRQGVESPEVGRRRADNGSFPPRPDDHAGWERWTAEGGPQPSVRRSADGRPVGLADALHFGGNGLVPQCAAEAFRQLHERSMT